MVTAKVLQVAFLHLSSEVQISPAALAQSAERFTRNEQVVGSIPTGGSEVRRETGELTGEELTHALYAAHQAADEATGP